MHKFWIKTDQLLKKRQHQDAGSPIYVTQPFLPPFEEYVEVLKDVWQTAILTNIGPITQQFERNLAQFLGLDNFIAVGNGTIAIQMAIKALELQGEIITTPFSWIATVSAIKAEGCTPVFCDIENDTYNLDPEKLEAQITEKTVAILPVHTFGNPCHIQGIEEIARKHNLKVIYDAAHALGSRYQNRSLLEAGDISATSLHATKLFNAAEGGGCIATDHALQEKLKRIRFFGHGDGKTIVEDGFNGKISEIHSALALVNLRYLEAILEDRKNKYRYYQQKLTDLDFLSFQHHKYGDSNFSYFPILLDTEQRVQQVEYSLNQKNIFPRRYFNPSLNTLAHIVTPQSMPVSEDISSRILCLPLFYELEYEAMDRIIAIIRACR